MINESFISVIFTTEVRVVVCVKRHSDTAFKMTQQVKRNIQYYFKLLKENEKIAKCNKVTYMVLAAPIS